MEPTFAINQQNNGPQRAPVIGSKKRPYEEITPLYTPFGERMETFLQAPRVKQPKLGEAPTALQIAECINALQTCQRQLQIEQQRRISQLQIALSALYDVYLNLNDANTTDAQQLVSQLATYFEVPFPPAT